LLQLRQALARTCVRFGWHLSILMARPSQVATDVERFAAACFAASDGQPATDAPKARLPGSVLRA
jgi:hypothetical protein